ncbi:ATP-binding protein [Niveibacterium sp. 24ML]|uniref:ATP-binding protein n=1 Tax=Niveibacterium sp. 24ML TaxID=2985512 RepID=UPI00227107D4|nr:ATP-binding protein [Niveibacterium sp. 24ML]MCX9157726.1 ATP-binding protein [Niveibacterium sp. 24ML]
MPRRKRSLRTSILLFVALGLALPAVLAWPLLYQSYQAEVERRIALQLDQYANILAFGAREPLWNLSPDAVRPLVEAVLSDPDVVTLTIVDRTAGALLEIKRGQPGANVRLTARKVIYKDRELGTVNVGVTGDTVRAQQLRQIKAFVGTTLIQLALAAGLIFWLLRRRLVAPLDSLGAAADALARGQLDQEIPSRGDDEIGHLASRLEVTRKELLGLFADLGTQNDALARELDERQRAEAGRRESEERLATVFALTAAPMSVTRKDDGLFLMVNPAWERTFGYDQGQVIGKVASDINLWVDDNDRRSCVAEINQYGLLAGREVWMRNRDGVGLLLEASARLFNAGGEELLVWNLRDITQERAAEEALRESEQRFAALFHHAPVALCIVDLEHGAKVLDLNTQFEHEFGRSLSDCIGTPLERLGLWAAPEDAERFTAMHTATDNQEKASAWLLGSDGRRGCYDIAGRHLTLHGSACFVWSAIDVTPIINAKAEVEDINRTLEEKVARRTHDLESANRELEQLLNRLQSTQKELVRSEKLASLGRLVAGIAHELNTPIGNCLMVASTLEDQRVEVSRALESGLRRSTLTDFLSGLADGNDTLLRNLHRAADLVSSFKQVAVDQTGSRRRSFDLREIAREIEVTLAPTFRKSGCSFSNEIPEGLEFDSFPGPLGQVITNLSTNAVAHAFDPGAGGQIRISAEKAGADYVKIEFSDNGHGISAENLPQIFDPFFTTKFGQGGSGLGLNIVYNIVTGMLGGNVHVESSPGAGTRFVITLPRNAPQTPGESEAELT